MLQTHLLPGDQQKPTVRLAPNNPTTPAPTRCADVVEEAYQSWVSNPFIDVRAVYSGHWNYMVDFSRASFWGQTARRGWVGGWVWSPPG